MENQRLTNREYNKLPNDPGVYKFINAEGDIIYVGKAKNLVKRVANYFTSIADATRKTQKLVREIDFIEFTIVDSEYDALLLENNLIKENQPKYNILLKDDKTFPSICISNDRFPLVYSTRTIDKRRGEYFGPYTSVKAMNGVLDLIRKLYKIRTCTLQLSERNIQKDKFKVCLEYHIGNCLGPCEGLQSEERYLQEIDSVRQILRGQINAVKIAFNQQMQTAASNLQYEQAHDYKRKVDFLEQFQTRSQIVNPRISNLEVFGVVTNEDQVFVNYMKIDGGSIKISETVEAKKKIELANNEFLQQILFTLKTKYTSDSTEILSNEDIEPWGDIVVIKPQIGDKKKLLDLSIKNALYSKNDSLARQNNLVQKQQHTLIQLQQELNLKELPDHIECFDNSNIQGAHPVASMVCFKNAKPSKRDYRKYNIKTVVGPDDFASMKEIVGRRYSHVLEEKLTLPHLIVIDGGKGQLHAACDALKALDLYGSIPIIGIAKRLEEIYFPEDSFPLHISKKSSALKLLQQIRDEAHRFAITFHRTKRSLASNSSALDAIEGIGPVSKNELLIHFKSTKRIASASLEELERVVGKSKAQKINAFFDIKKGNQ